MRQRARWQNPIRRYKERHALTYPALAERLGISKDFAKKLGTDGRACSPDMAKQFETRTGGGIRYLDVMRWIKGRIGDGAAA